MRSLILFCGLVASFSQLSAQPAGSITGSWEGSLNVGAELRIVFHIREAGPGRLTATLDSPDQGAFGIPCDTAYLQAGELTIELKPLSAKYTGRQINDSTIEGSFTQGMEFPLSLKRAEPKDSEMPPVNLDTRYRPSEISVRGDSVVLSGTLLEVPGSTKAPIALLISGSGPTDRDGNTILIPGKNNSLRQLAEELGDRGIASLRYDKRGVGRSTLAKGVTEENITINQIVNDARAMYEYLQSQGYNQIYLAGHSEGSLIAILLARQVNPAGLISIAGSGRKAKDILAEQLSAQLPAELMNRFTGAADSIEAGIPVTTVPPALASLLRPSVQPYLTSWFRQDPKSLVGELRCPILILQGTKDIQVSEKDAALLHEGNPASKLVLVPNMNHVLKTVNSDDPAENRKAYSDSSLRIAEQLVNEIVSFMKN